MTIRILDNNGEATKVYDMTAAEEAALAAKEFNAALSMGKQAIGRDKEGELFMDSSFRPDAVEYVIGPRLVGG